MASLMEYKPKTEDLNAFRLLDDAESAICRDEQSIPAFEDPEYQPPKQQRREILDFGDEGFLLGQILTGAECQYYIQEAERLGFGDIPEAKKSYRNSDRIVLRSPQLADLLWKRVEPFLKDFDIPGDPHEVHIHGVPTLLQGTWTPLRVNDLFRLCRYEPGGHFGPHFDGHFVVSADVRTMKTAMIYLNGGFQGGSTNFVDEEQILYMDDKGRYTAEEKNILCRIQPEPGLGIVFNHHRLHEGQALGSGVKYILRTDILYQRQSGPAISDQETEALRLAQEAERLEAMGDCMRAMEMYRKAFRLSPSLAESYGCPT